MINECTTITIVSNGSSETEKSCYTIIGVQSVPVIKVPNYQSLCCHFLVRISWLFTQSLEIQFSFNIVVFKVVRRICPVTYQRVGNSLLPCTKERGLPK